jgi:hypothetical protein
MAVEPSSAHPTKRPMDSGDFAVKLGLYYAQAESRFDGESKSRLLPLPNPLGILIIACITGRTKRNKSREGSFGDEYEYHIVDYPNNSGYKVDYCFLHTRSSSFPVNNARSDSKDG